MNDSDLLRQFAQNRSQEAFAQLVARHADWIYSAAVRLVKDRHLAEDVTQAVFMVLSRQAPRLAHVPLNAWLFKVTRYSAANALRSQSRREKHERQAAAMNPLSFTPDPSTWDDLAPQLDELVGRLRSDDRQTLLLRFYQRKTLAQVGDALGISEDAARKRVERAVEKLRGLLLLRKEPVSASSLDAILLANITHPAPTALVGHCITGSASAATASIAKGTTTMLFASKLKVAAIAAAILLVPAGIGTLLVAAAEHSPPPPAPSAQAQVVPAADAPGVPSTSAANSPSTQPALDALLSPVLDSQVAMIRVADLSSFDLDSFKKRLSAIAYSDPVQAQYARREIDNEVQFSQQFKQAGGKQLYFLESFGSAQLNRTCVIPLDKNTDRAAMQQFSQAVVNGGQTTTTPTSMVTRSPADATPSQPRPDLLEAIAAGDSAVRVAYAPALLRNQQVPLRLAPLGISAALYTDPVWDHVKWCLLEIVIIPDQPSIMTYQCSDHLSAVALASFLSQKTAGQPDFFKLFVGSQPQVDDARVLIPLDPHNVDSVVLGPIFALH